MVSDNITETSYQFNTTNKDVLIEVFAIYENEISSVGVSIVTETENTDNPEDPEQPEQPEDPEQPEQPEDPEQPEVPEEGIEELSSSINIYPNPVKDELTIATEIRVEEVSIYDIYGRLCCRDASNASTSTMDTFNVSVQDLENGIYFINIKTDKGNIVKRFIKN